MNHNYLSVHDGEGSKVIEVTLKEVHGKGSIKAIINYVPENKFLMAIYIRKEKASRRINKIKKIFKK